MLVGALVVAAFVGTAGPVFASAAVSLDPAPDGTLMLVGRGWRPGQELVISLGTDTYPAQADSSGSFEVPTGLLISGGPPLSMTVRRPDRSALAFAQLAPTPAPEGQNPFALLFAESLAMGAKFFGLGAGGLGLAALVLRAIRARQRGARASQW